MSELLFQPAYCSVDMVDCSSNSKSCTVWQSHQTHDEYCGPLSLTTVSGMPCCEKTALRASITCPEVVPFTLITSGYLEK